tara:strand:- start:489 stop:824 length:336 start_codon:yes stop_codon:yes gene_type:complete
MINLDDINIRPILNIKEYILINSQNIYKCEKKKISYFYVNDTKICIGYLLYNNIIIPVIGMKDIILRKKLKNELSKCKKKMEIKKKFNNYIFLIHYTNLPYEILEKIMYFY